MIDTLAIVWDFDPTLLRIGSFDIRYYGAMWALTILLGGWMFSYFCKREGMSQELSDSAFIYITLGTIIGSRLGHCLFYDPVYYLSQPWTIITEIRDGGMASHGAVIGILFSMWLCGRRNKVPFMWLCDRLTIISTIGGAIVRLGNFFNSEIIGIETDVPWGVKFVRLYPGVPVESIPARHPAQLYEALCYLAIFVLLWILYKRTSAPRRFGLIAGIGLIGMFTMRFIIEFIKVEQVDFEKGMILDMGQLLSIPTVLLGVCFVWYALKHQPFDLEHVAAVNRKWVEEQSKTRAKGEKKGKKR